MKLRVACDHFTCIATEWATEPREISAGVDAARTPFNNKSPTITVRVLNYSNKPYVLREDSLLSSAEPVTVVSQSDCVDDAKQ